MADQIGYVLLQENPVLVQPCPTCGQIEVAICCRYDGTYTYIVGAKCIKCGYDFVKLVVQAGQVLTTVTFVLPQGER